MTQRKWETLDGWSVLTGWDRPLQYFFVSINRACQACNGDGGFGVAEDESDVCGKCEGSGDEYLFNNLSDTTGYTDAYGGMTLTNVKRVLDEKLTTYPADVLLGLQQDKAGDVGNFIETYPTQGEQRVSTAASG